MGLVGLLLAVLLVGLAWFYYPSTPADTAPTNRILEARATVDETTEIRNALQGRNDETSRMMQE